MNLRPSGYEPDELPDCSTPHQMSGRDSTAGSLRCKRRASRELALNRANADLVQMSVVKP